MFHWAQTRRAAAMLIKLAFRVTALCNFFFSKKVMAVADVIAYSRTHTHTCALCSRGRWIGEQIVSDMLISSPSLTTEAIKVKGHEPQPSRLSSPSFFCNFSHSRPPPSLPPSSSCRRAFQGATMIKEMFNVAFCFPASHILRSVGLLRPRRWRLLISPRVTQWASHFKGQPTWLDT